MNKNIIIGGISIIVIAIFIYMITTIVINNKENKIDVIEIQNKRLISKTDSLIITNHIIDSLNKKDGTDVKNIKKNIQTADSIINNSNLRQLQHILQKHIL